MKKNDDIVFMLLPHFFPVMTAIILVIILILQILEVAFWGK